MEKVITQNCNIFPLCLHCKLHVLPCDDVIGIIMTFLKLPHFPYIFWHQIAVCWHKRSKREVMTIVSPLLPASTWNWLQWLRVTLRTSTLDDFVRCSVQHEIHKLQNLHNLLSELWFLLRYAKWYTIVHRNRSCELHYSDKDLSVSL